MSDRLINTLNNDMTEPQTRLFSGNGPRSRQQSQLLLMINVPTQEELNLCLSISPITYPSGDIYIDLGEGTNSGGTGDAEFETSEGRMYARAPPDTQGIMGLCLQYTLRHTGPSTIKKNR